MSKKTAKHENMFVKCVKAPYRVLCGARDFYVRMVMDCSGHMSYGMAAGPTHMMPRNFSVKSSRSNQDEDINNLIRAASQRGLREKLELDIKRLPQNLKLPRSSTVAIGRIDENEASEFDDDIKTDMTYPRSKSSAVTKRKTYT
ncbi:hypothetical protein ACHQM5_024834 [Ranunculus cassubicifolius]